MTEASKPPLPLPATGQRQPLAAPDLLDLDGVRRQATCRVGDLLLVIELPRDAEQATAVTARPTAGDARAELTIRWAVPATWERASLVAERRLRLPAGRLANALRMVAPSVRQWTAQAASAAPVSGQPAAPAVSATEAAEADRWLAGSDVLDRLHDAAVRLGLRVDADLGRLLLLTALSRRLPQPAWLALRGARDLPAVPVQVIAAMTPPEEVLHASVPGDGLLVATEAGALQHRLLVLDDLAVPARVATHLRILAAAGRLTHQIVHRDPEGGPGRLRLHRVEGPLALLGAVVDGELDPRLGPALAPVDHLPADPHAARVMVEAEFAHQRGGDPGLPDAARAALLRQVHAVQRRWQTAGMRVRVGDDVIGAGDSIPPGPGSPETRRDRRLAITLAATSALLHQAHRARDDDGALLASPDDVALAARLLARRGASASAPVLTARAATVLAAWQRAGGAPLGEAAARALLSRARAEAEPPTAYAVRTTLEELVAAGLACADGGGQGRKRTYALVAAHAVTTTESAAAAPTLRNLVNGTPLIPKGLNPWGETG